VSWPKPDLAEFHLKLVAAATARLVDPVALVDAQRREVLLIAITAATGTLTLGLALNGIATETPW